ncbi:MAG: bi-domain-containing oxidoreductase [Acidobacteriota bacterium]
MKALVQQLRDGALAVRTIPAPFARAGHVVIANLHSVLSPGTERASLDLARRSLLGKARARPDQVRKVLDSLRQEGFWSTLAKVNDRLDRPAHIGYSSAGVVVACGRGVQEVRPGDRVASNGPHAGVVTVARHLCAPIPDSVPTDEAAFAVIGAIALNGVRLARVELGATALVIGLGLVGQLAVAILRAAGCRVHATDPDPWRCEIARRMGATRAETHLDGAGIATATAGAGADAVLVAAATPSREPMDLAADAVRKKGRVVLLGVVGLELDRRAWYFKEAELVVSCSYGPGRYDADYEERGRDYPLPHVRWTEQRNIAAVLDLMADRRVDVRPLVTHRFPIADAMGAYELLERGDSPHLGILLEYPPVEEAAEGPTISMRPDQPTQGRPGIGVLGAGAFAQGTLLPAIARTDVERVVIASPGGLSTAHAGERHGFAAATTDESLVLSNPAVSAVFIATRHDDHARQAAAALTAGKHVFVEKPVALDEDELAVVEAALASSPGKLLMVGFNRRFAPATREMKDFLAAVQTPLTINVRFNAGPIPPDHWTQDGEVGGGRIIGEACHAIDLATYLCGSHPVRVFAEAIGGPNAPPIRDDQCFITLRHASGSVSSIAYAAGGDRAFGKERVEVFGGGRVAVLDNFRQLETAVAGRVRSAWARPTKAIASRSRAFLDAVQRRTTSIRGGPRSAP